MATESRDQAAPALEARRIVYNDSIVRWFIGASVLFGVVAMLVGVIIALQLAVWQANVHPILTFGRLRPLHTNAAIFAFVGNMLFAGIYYLRLSTACRSEIADRVRCQATGVA
jgi:cytochrome c oxidase cbb3-type subunit I/II